MDKYALSMEFNFNKQLDIAKAVSQLTPKEQLVVNAIGLGNETLASLSEFSLYERQNLWRTWATAKDKLRALLNEYAE